MIVAGIMTGTSVDAIDVAICEILEQGDRHTITLLLFHTHPYRDALREQVAVAIDGQSTVMQLSSLSFELAKAYADAFHAAREQFGATRPIEAIGAHGQTITHDPPHSTWQALSGSALAALTSTRVVHDFRAADVALGGQGAPLVPLFDVATLASESKELVALNIGGMANITLLPSEKFKHGFPQTDLDIVAFDTGPGNILIDAAAQRFYGKRFDDGGSIARAGVVIEPMLDALQSLPYFNLAPPKSTGRELFNEQLVMDLAERYRVSLRPSEDVLATVTELTAWSIAEHIHKYQPLTTDVFVSGGGVNNSFLLGRIQSLLPETAIKRSDMVGVPYQAKEAMAFAYFAWRSLHGLPSSMPSVTGASRSAVLGSVSFA